MKEYLGSASNVLLAPLPNGTVMPCAELTILLGQAVYKNVVVPSKIQGAPPANVVVQAREISDQVRFVASVGDIDNIIEHLTNYRKEIEAAVAAVTAEGGLKIASDRAAPANTN